MSEQFAAGRREVAVRGSWLARRLADGLMLAGAVALALPLILPFG